MILSAFGNRLRAGLV